MKVISLSGHSKRLFEHSCAAIGIFDGVHCGHQYLIKEMLLASRQLKVKPIVITFFPHPAHVLRPDIKLAYLASFKERCRLLGDLGVEAVIVIPFDTNFAKIQPGVFIKKILVETLGVNAIFIGEDFRFGRERVGDITLFKELSGKYGYAVHALKAYEAQGAIISSTRIRQSILSGKLNIAARLLGRPYGITGPVIKGDGRGKTLGVPTANVDYEGQVLPPNGVYIAYAYVKDKPFKAVVNIGRRPSFKANNDHVHVEAHLLDFDAKIYGKEIKLVFLKKIRPEKKFPTSEALVKQINKDQSQTRKYFLKTPQ